MKKKCVYKVTVCNGDRTTIWFLADTQLEAIHMYEQYMKENYAKDFLDENQNFYVEFVNYVYYV